jgi:hypothetical protein
MSSSLTLKVPYKDHSRVTAAKHIAKRNRFAPNVLRRRKWRKSGLRPIVAKLETFATRAFWLTVHAHSQCMQKGLGNSL